MGFCLRTAFVSLGALGPLLRVLVLGTLVWMLKDYGIVNPDSPSLLAWVTLIVIGIILAAAFPGRYCTRA
jgi:Family of unknown function (DUF6524)